MNGIKFVKQELERLARWPAQTVQSVTALFHPTPGGIVRPPTPIPNPVPIAPSEPRKRIHSQWRPVVGKPRVPAHRLKQRVHAAEIKTPLSGPAHMLIHPLLLKLLMAGIKDLEALNTVQAIARRKMDVLRLNMEFFSTQIIYLRPEEDKLKTNAENPESTQQLQAVQEQLQKYYFERSILRDQYRALKLYLSHLSSPELEQITEEQWFQARQQFPAQGLPVNENQEIGDAEFERLLGAFVANQLSKPWKNEADDLSPGVSEFDDEYASEDAGSGQYLLQQLSEAANEVVKYAEDPTGRNAEQQLRDAVEQHRQQGHRIIPKHVLDQYALVLAAEAVHHIVNTKRRYRRLKKIAREKGISHRRKLLADTEYDFDVDAMYDEFGPWPEEWFRSSNKACENWWQKLPARSELLDGFDFGSAREPDDGKTLLSLSLASGVSHQRCDLYYEKRAQQYRQNQVLWDEKTFASRSQVKSPPKPEEEEEGRELRQRLNPWIIQKTVLKRVSNGQPRKHQDDGASTDDEDVFRHWYRVRDPEESKPVRRASQQPLKQLPSSPRKRPSSTPDMDGVQIGKRQKSMSLVHE